MGRSKDSATVPSPDFEMKGKTISDQPLPPPSKHAHGFASRTEAGQPLGNFTASGKFGRMFPFLQGLEPNEAHLGDLAKHMLDLEPHSTAGDNPDLPAGYTYLGQFIDHDITFDTSSLQDMLSDPLALQNFRTPALDLDSVYGSGPVVQPYLYEGKGRDRFQIGKTRVGRGDARIPAGLPNDLPRAPSTAALIGDPRNDENLIVQQMHLLFLKFHNKVLDQIESEVIPRGAPVRKSAFEEARDIVLWHYQWIVLHDFLPRIVNGAVLNDVLTHGRRFYRPRKHPFIPLEFSAAAYRFGHSMVREEYEYNRVFTSKQLKGDAVPQAPATLSALFQFTGFHGSSEDGAPTPSDWIIDWRRFFLLDKARPPGLSRRIDPFVSKTMHRLPERDDDSRRSERKFFSLPERTLLRGVRLKLPSGQSLARVMGYTPLTPGEIAQGPDGAVAEDHELASDSPLWYYILKEAQIQGKGKRLGQVGSRILAEVFVGLLDRDPSSFRARRPSWTPTLPSEKVGRFTMADLIRYVNDINPIDDTAR